MSDPPQFRFRMYVAGHTPNSTRAVANLRALCNEHLAGRHEIEIVDVFRDPERALADKVLMTPMLLRTSPLPVVRVMGSLTDAAPVLHAFATETPPPCG